MMKIPCIDRSPRQNHQSHSFDVVPVRTSIRFFSFAPSKSISMRIFRAPLPIGAIHESITAAPKLSACTNLLQTDPSIKNHSY